MKAEFTAIIEAAPEGGYWAICPEIPGANGQGETIEETKNSLRQAIELILEDRKADILRDPPASDLLSPPSGASTTRNSPHRSSAPCRIPFHRHTVHPPPPPLPLPPLTTSSLPAFLFDPAPVPGFPPLRLFSTHSVTSFSCLIRFFEPDRHSDKSSCLIECSAFNRPCRFYESSGTRTSTHSLT